MSQISFENWKTSATYGGAIWVIAFFYATIIMVILGVDFSDSENQFGPDHDKYWEFEAIVIPSFVIIGFLIFRRLYSKTGMNLDNWKAESLGIGLLVAIIQFMLDLIFLAWIFGGGMEYFYALVTLSYFLIPFWAYLFGWYLYGRAA
ncbi:MAG: hypothetical protein HeimC2_07290 [Candidatus Heimdallarchaeota archaeon LC_2]|nr:MAG: hypothetical protein HeimC2_07290 [Candidatus Heimdallarchaeota archaeon LC_2]